MTPDIYRVVAEFRARVRRAVDGADGAQYWEQRDEIAALRALVAELCVEGARLREQVIDLHTDSPAGVCPSCGRIGEQSDTDDGLVPWPCPTVLAVKPGAGVLS